MTPDPTGAFCVVVGALLLGSILGNLHDPKRLRMEHFIAQARARPLLFGALLVGGMLAACVLLTKASRRRRRKTPTHAHDEAAV